MVVIYKTDKYDLFKNKKGNRPVAPGHVNRLIRSIRKNNLLPANPIIINKHREIIDGQHRLEAAKIMKLPVFYVEFEPASLTEIQLMNANQKSWTAIDFMESYIEMGKKDYKIFKNFLEKYNLPLTASMGILSQKMTGAGMGRIFKEGKFKVGDLKEAEKIGQEINDMKPVLSWGVLSSSRFYTSIGYLVKKGTVKLYDITYALKASGKKIYPADSRNGYLDQFEDVLNLKRTGKRITLY